MGTDTSGTPDGLRRRRKGAMRYSCAECRRLKLRCDRSFPCESCVKRGCEAICPDLSLTTGQGNRFVLATTTELHAKISQLSNRVRQLEDGLRSTYSQLPGALEVHPLLTEELLKIKAPLQRELPATQNSLGVPKEEESNPDIVDAFGSLSISISGRAKYFGHIANSWYFLQNEFPEDEDREDQPSDLVDMLPPDILAHSAAFPVSPTSISTFQLAMSRRNLLQYLPDVDRAGELRSIFFRYAAWMYRPISLEFFDEQIYRPFFGLTSAYPVDDILTPHRQSLLFMVLAIGSLMDLSQPAFNMEAEKYHQLARATLFSSSLFEEPTSYAVQTLFLITFYLFLADRHTTNTGGRWAIMGLAVKIAQSIGLHRDSGRWKKVDQAETRRRRELFWELYTYDSWQCLTFGRPPSFSLAHIDCKLPHDQNSSNDQSFHAWKHRFASECMSIMHDQAFGAKTPPYATILQLDSKIHTFPVPAILQIPGFGGSEPLPDSFPESIELILQRHIVLAIREINLLYLHRGFFAQAISEQAKDPFGHPYGGSVIRAYRSAETIVALVRNLYGQLKEPSERLWFLWGHMFSCAIVLGAIVTRCPSMTFAPSALGHLDAACEVFSKVAQNFRAQKVLAIMLQLQEKAHASMESYKKGAASSTVRRTPAETLVNGGDELDILGGKTRLVSDRDVSSCPPLTHGIPGSTQGSTSSPLSVPANGPVYPSVNKDMHDFSADPYHPGAGVGPLPSSPQLFSDGSYYGNAPASMLQTPYQQSVPAVLPQHQQYAAHLPYLHMTETTHFPQYFPVYEYASASSQNGYHMEPDAMNASPPEANMDTAWQDFVAGFSTSMNS